MKNMSRKLVDQAGMETLQRQYYIVEWEEEMPMSKFVPIWQTIQYVGGIYCFKSSLCFRGRIWKSVVSAGVVIYVRITNLVIVLHNE